MRTPPARLRAIAAFVVLTASACMSTDAGGWVPAQPVHADSRTYQAAVESFLACMSGHGYRVFGPVLSPLDQRILLRDVEPSTRDDAALYNSRLDACERDANLATIEPAYLESQPSVMDPRLLPDAARCLQQQGVTPRGNERSYTDFVAQAKVSHEFGHCVTEAARTKFPGLPPRITVFY